MQKYLDIIEKHNCKLVNGKILTSTGADTRIIFENLLKINETLVGFENSEEQQQNLLDMFESELVMRNEVLANV
jgi:hypothetical protein